MVLAPRPDPGHENLAHPCGLGHGATLEPAPRLVALCAELVWFLPPLLLTLPFGLSPAAVGWLIVVWVLVWALLSRFHDQKQFWHDVWAGTRLVTFR